MKIFLFHCSFLIAVIFSINVHAQPGASCASAVSISNGTYLSSENVSGTKWYSFIADTGLIQITVNSFFQGDTAIQDVKLYNGSCASLSLVENASRLTFPILNTSFHNTVASQIFYIEITGSSYYTSSYSFKLSWQGLQTYNPCSCPSSLINSNTNCDRICNGSFEYLNGVITGPQQLDDACPWRDPIPYASSSDVFSSSSVNPNYSAPNNGLGTEVPHTGSSYAGFSPYCHPAFGYAAILDSDYKEYVCAPLNQTLVAGQCYTLEFYLSLAENSRYGSGNFGVLFSTFPASQTGTFTQFINATPQILFSAIQTSTNWVQYSATYTANGTEAYMTIGNFESNYNTPTTQLGPVNTNPNQILNYSAFSYYYIDDVSLTPCCNNLSVASFPTDFCYGDQVNLFCNTACPNVTYVSFPENRTV